MTILVLLLVIGLIPAMIAYSKGRNFLLWYVYGVALFLIALVHALLLKPDLLATGEFRKCPSCAEPIKVEAKVCRYCGRDAPPRRMLVGEPGS
jgi:hypothetical protein